jgi:hypothetical protein
LDVSTTRYVVVPTLLNAVDQTELETKIFFMHEAYLEPKCTIAAPRILYRVLVESEAA